MAKNKFPISYHFITALLAAIFISVNGLERRVHIVYMGSVKNRAMAKPTHHLNLLKSVIGSSYETESSYIRSYGRSFNGFAAKLTATETAQLAAMEGVVSVFENKELKTQTTRSWNYLGFNKKAKRNPAGESDVIIGSIDTGIWPELESFNDEGLDPPPLRWRGECAGGENFTCNNKIIGARYYTGPSARDTVGHGTHTASTAAGQTVKTSGFFGIGGGIARGAVPSSRIAVYKVCNPTCSDMNTLAAFDDAIADGVDVITISIGGLGAIDFENDSIAIGSYHAMARGILTVHAVGNDGPEEGTVTSIAPWLFSAGATTTDRTIVDEVVLGNGKRVIGNSVNSFLSNNNKSFPLIYGTNASKICSSNLSQVCAKGCLDPGLVKGKIVQCMSFIGLYEALKVGANGAIVLNDNFDNVSFVVPLASSALNKMDFVDVANYINSSLNPLVRILKSVAIKDEYAPMVASFSSRGPNLMMPEIMKPDIVAPGVEILAAFSPIVSPSDDVGDKRSVEFTIMSGTSMSCPHVAGVAAYVKSFYRQWSPSTIKSAIMTTAKQIIRTDGHIGEFLYGSGQINPKQAIKPGLVYDILEEDYLNFLCGNGFDSKTIRVISGNNKSCSTKATKFLSKDLNYPAMAIQVLPIKPFVVKFKREVTNVGIENSTYKSTLLPFSQVYVHKSPEKLNVSVEPRELSFRALNEKKSFIVTVVGGAIPSETVFSTSLVWSDGIHKVRSPVIVRVSSESSRM